MTISAKIIADSVNPNGEQITTFELEYPRFIHSEFMTHRDFSRNASSSRAIPIWKMIKHVWFNMARPIHWGKKQKGMQADKEINPVSKAIGFGLWTVTGWFVSIMTLLMKLMGVHKQVANRMLEPWTHIKVVMTTTKYDNWFNLRDHKDAQPEIRELAVQMRKAMKNSTPRKLEWGGWHLPYVTEEDRQNCSINELIEISATACAQVSYRILNTSMETVKRVFALLINADVIHASPFEHPARATKNGGSGNFTGTKWKQYRFYVERNIGIPNHN